MSIPLTREQREATEQSETPVRLIDPDNKREYVLLRVELYERLRQIAQAEVIDPSLYEFEEPAEMLGPGAPPFSPHEPEALATDLLSVANASGSSCQRENPCPLQPFRLSF